MGGRQDMLRLEYRGVPTHTVARCGVVWSVTWVYVLWSATCDL
jgi:hypothetical protein